MFRKKIYIFVVIVAIFIISSPLLSSAGARCTSCSSTKSYKNPIASFLNFNYYKPLFGRLLAFLSRFMKNDVTIRYTNEGLIQCNYPKIKCAIEYEEYYLEYATIYTRCAVIIGGGTGHSNNYEISHCADKIYVSLKNKGFTDENIFYISPENVRGVDAYSNKENVRYALKYWLKSHSSSITECFIFLLGHGNHRRDEGLLLLGQGYVGESDIAKWIRDLRYKKCLIVVGCCAGDYFKDGLSGKNREILTPSKYYATSHDINMLIDYALSKIDTEKSYKKPLPYDYRNIYPYKPKGKKNV
jgi:hypothetical protein